MLFCRMTSIDMQMRVYTETNTLYGDLAEGRIAATFNNTMSVLPRARAGGLRMLASTGAQRSATEPDLPTMAESALPGCEVVNWIGILAPRRMPQEIVTRTSRAIARAVGTPEVRRLFEEHGMEPVSCGPGEFEAHLRGEFERWGRFIEANRDAFPVLQ
jgi:tripartite-type tricarboxylate transporter receptor subunit TctC